ncbi:GNAT family N-acetyltransferase [Fontibacillus sp. BL9]|uniref:GNAT family N-acetyltransferase n=1 Tax=Fontibacillus sp. BL9 TaxID=3389971 RepID=UPI00397B70CA
MIDFQVMNPDQATKLKEIDRSEYIDLIYQMQDGKLVETSAGHECPSWNEELLREMEDRFLYELQNGGTAFGAFDGNRLIGFGVLAHQFRGEKQDRLQIDLMYVSRSYRRQGIGTSILTRLEEEARTRGARYLYISSTETRSAVSFYKSMGSRITKEVDEELFQKEPLDIHMLKEL